MMPDTNKSLSDILLDYKKATRGQRIVLLTRAISLLGWRSGHHLTDVSNASYANMVAAYQLFIYADYLREIECTETTDAADENPLSLVTAHLHKKYGYLIEQASDEAFIIVDNAHHELSFVAIETQQIIEPIYLVDESRFTFIEKKTGKPLTSINGEVVKLSLFELLANSHLDFIEMKSMLSNQLTCLKSSQLTSPEANLELIAKLKEIQQPQNINQQLLKSIPWNTLQYESANQALKQHGFAVLNAVIDDAKKRQKALLDEGELEHAKTYLSQVQVDDAELRQKRDRLITAVVALEDTTENTQPLAVTLYITAFLLNNELKHEEAKAAIPANTIAAKEAIDVVNTYRLKHGTINHALQLLESKKAACTNETLRIEVDKLLTEVKLLVKYDIENQEQLKLALYNTVFLMDNELGVDAYRASAETFIQYGKASNELKAVGLLMLAISIAVTVACIVTASATAAVPIGIGAMTVGGILFFCGKEHGLSKITRTIAELQETKANNM